MSKTEEYINEAKSLKQEMVDMARNNADVQRYLRLEGKRKRIHKKLEKHIIQYGVDTDKFKPMGLVASHRSSVSVKDTNYLAQDIGGDIGKRIFNLISKTFVVYTK